jgi:hypothetical protein
VPALSNPIQFTCWLLVKFLVLVVSIVSGLWKVLSTPPMGAGSPLAARSVIDFGDRGGFHREQWRAIRAGGIRR